MKSCPACLTQYTDDTLQYCLQDGTPLIAAPQSDLPTVVIGETETFVNPRSRARNLDTRPDLSASANAARPRSYTAVAVATTALVMLVIFGLIGFGAFLYFRNKNRIQTSNSNSTSSKGNLENRNTAPSPTPTTTRVENRSFNSTQPGNRATSGTVTDETRDEIRRQIDSWRAATEEMDLDALMDHYAPRVEYYNKRGADAGFIRADKERAFARFDDISMKISNLDVTPNGTNDILNVVFDKEWRFRGERTSTGKVRQLLQLKRINGTWLITSERDLKVY